MSLISLTLYLDLRPEAPAGPAWYVVGSLAPEAGPLPITDASVQDVMSAFIRALGQARTVDPVALYQTGNKEIEAELRRQLEFAENQAGRIAMLRTRLARTTSDIVKEADEERTEDQRNDL